MSLPNTYSGGICKTQPDQISHHKKHLLTQKHKDKYELFELIIASYNDALLENLVDEKLKVSFINFIKQNKNIKNYELVINYWIKIKSDDYPVGYILEKIK